VGGILTAYIEALNSEAVLCLGKALSVVSNPEAVFPPFHPMEYDPVS